MKQTLTKKAGFFIFTTIFLLAGFFGASDVKAGLAFQNGNYVNLCGSGTAANIYSCSAACNVKNGSCAGQNNGVVKYVCNGRWDQCLESESYWTNYAEIGQVACGKTVQLSVFDKKCRNEEGVWDNSCKLTGYMVWYSGDCQTGVVSATPTARLIPTATLTPTPTLKASPTPTAIVSKVVTPTVTPSPSPKPTSGAGMVCNKSCVLDSECGAGFKCLAGSCRNPSCSGDTSCFCGNVTPTPKKNNVKSPETGGEEVLLVVGVLAIVGGGLVIRRMASKI